MEKEFLVKATPGGELDESILLNLKVDRRLAERIHFLARNVASLGVHTISEYCYEPSWHELDYDESDHFVAGDNIRVECETLNVQKKYVTFSCYRKHCSVEFYSDHIQLEDFLPMFGLEVPCGHKEVNDESI